MTVPSKAPVNHQQLKKFQDAQREHETDQSQEHFDAVLKKVAKAPKSAYPSKKTDAPQKNS